MLTNVASGWANSSGAQIIVAAADNFGHKKSMFSRACSAAVNGIDAYAIEVEVNCGYGETFIALFCKIPLFCCKRFITSLLQCYFTMVFSEWER